MFDNKWRFQNLLIQKVFFNQQVILAPVALICNKYYKEIQILHGSLKFHFSVVQVSNVMS